MIIKKIDYLDDDMLDRMTDLVLDVNEADGGNYEIPDDADFYALLFDEGGDSACGDGTGKDERVGEYICGSKNDGVDTHDVKDDVREDGTVPGEMLSAVALYEMGETYQGKPVMEIVAFTSPIYRNRGFWSILLDSLKGELNGFSVRFAVYPDTAVPATLAALKSLGTIYDHDELLMVCSIVKWPNQKRSTISVTLSQEYDDVKTSGDTEGKSKNGHIEKLQAERTESKEDVARIQADPEQSFFVTTPYGECHFRRKGQDAYIYGILTYKRFQNKGYAFLMLKELFSYLGESGAENVFLEVSSQNIPAVKLYKKLGFKVNERLSYYYLE